MELKEMKMLKKTIVLGAVICSFLTGCGQSHMDKLKSDEVSGEFTNSFYMGEHEKNTEFWNEGVKYCLENTSKINCKLLLKNYELFKKFPDGIMRYGMSGDVIDVHGGQKPPVYNSSKPH